MEDYAAPLAPSWVVRGGWRRAAAAAAASRPPPLQRPPPPADEWWSDSDAASDLSSWDGSVAGSEADDDAWSETPWRAPPGGPVMPPVAAARREAEPWDVRAPTAAAQFWPGRNKGSP